MILQVFGKDDHIQLKLGESRATLLMQGRRGENFLVKKIEVLDHRKATEIVDIASKAKKPFLVTFDRSSPEARSYLRKFGLSYVAANGEVFIFRPPIYIERPPTKQKILVRSSPASPFATRASRISRWLLLHPTETPSFRQLSKELQLSEALVSRTMHSLSDKGLVTIVEDPTDARVKKAHLKNSGTLLDAFELGVANRSIRRVSWDIGARSAPQAIELIKDSAGDRLKLPYAIGGIAGASFIRRVVEPFEVSVWIAPQDIRLWQEELGAIPARAQQGSVTALLTNDQFTLEIATDKQGIMIADPVQLYLDCRFSGERALEAADAVRTEMNW